MRASAHYSKIVCEIFLQTTTNGEEPRIEDINNMILNNTVRAIMIMNSFFISAKKIKHKT